MDFDIPADLAAYLKELDAFIEREIKPLENENDNIRFFDHRREDARTDWHRGGLPNEEWEALLREARRRIEELTCLPGICPDSPEWYAQMAAFPLPACAGAALQRRLYEEYRVEVPVIEWNGRQLKRVSVQGYNRKADVETLVESLGQLLAQPSGR